MKMHVKYLKKKNNSRNSRKCHFCRFIMMELNSTAWPRGNKKIFMLNLIEHEIFPAHKC